LRSRPIPVDLGSNRTNSPQNHRETPACGLTWNNLRRGEEIIDSGILAALLPLLAFVALTAGNAFFVAAEFSLVTVSSRGRNSASRSAHC
jgi:hypothetical protein